MKALFLVALVAAVVPVAAAQAPTVVPPPIDQMKQWRMSETAGGGMLLSGDVELLLAADGVTIHADEAEYRPSTSDMPLRGKVLVSVSSLPTMKARMVTGAGSGIMRYRGDVSVVFGTRKTIIHADEADYDDTTKTLHLRGHVRLEFASDAPRK